MRNYIVLICLAALFSGCVSRSPKEWHNVSLTGDASRRQLVIDNAYCNRVALQSAPMPRPRTYIPTQQTYEIDAVVTTYGPGGVSQGYVTGTVGPRKSFGQGFADGFQAGQELKEKRRAREAQDQAHQACMYKLGWDDQ